MIWVGIRNMSNPPHVSFHIGDVEITPKNPQEQFASLNTPDIPFCRAIFVFGQSADKHERFTVRVSCAGETVELITRCLPAQLPEFGKDSFNFLLTSCYFQPNDKVGVNCFSEQMKNLKPAPDFIYFAGDQVYLDLPVFGQNLSKKKEELTQALEKKYQDNWFPQSSQPGLAGVLSLGPVLCIPDDHEFWNNFPHPQAQLNNTYSRQDRDHWGDVARDLYRLYQSTPAQEDGLFRMDIEPLCMLFVDGRSMRDTVMEHMFNDASLAAIVKWKQDLLTRKSNQLPAVGLLSSGQTLLMEKPNRWEREFFDAEMPNYKDYDEVLKKNLVELINAGIPVIYLTGDVHWGRIIEGTNQTGQVMLYEIIASPSRLQNFVVKDQWNAVTNAIKGIWGNADPFPMHDDPPKEVPQVKFANLDFRIKHPKIGDYPKIGDHVAMLRFNRIPGGVILAVDYYCTHPDSKIRNTYNRTIESVKITSLN